MIKKFGKRNIAFVGGFVALGGQILFFLNPYSFGFMVMSCVTRAIGLAPLNAVVFSMVGDVVEFGQWKNHIRQESLIFAGGSYSWSAWATGYFVSCLPGIIIQLILIPIIYVALERAHLLPVRYAAGSATAEAEAT